MVIKRAQLLIFIMLIIFGLAPVVHSGTTDVPPVEVSGAPKNIALNDTITVEVKNLSEYLNYPNNPNNDPKKFMLYLDWRPIKGVNAFLNRDNKDKDKDKLQFDVKRTADSKEQWNALLGSPFAKGHEYPVNVSVGYENQSH
jgi:hypothetical protein